MYFAGSKAAHWVFCYFRIGVTLQALEYIGFTNLCTILARPTQNLFYTCCMLFESSQLDLSLCLEAELTVLCKLRENIHSEGAPLQYRWWEWDQVFEG